jgi:hypothetical protein
MVTYEHPALEVLCFQAPKAAVRRICSYHNGVNKGAAKGCHRNAGADCRPLLQSCIGFPAEHQIHALLPAVHSLQHRSGWDATVNPAEECRSCCKPPFELRKCRCRCSQHPGKNKLPAMILAL